LKERPMFQNFNPKIAAIAAFAGALLVYFLVYY
jgi:hypothetical protein